MKKPAPKLKPFRTADLRALWKKRLTAPLTAAAMLAIANAGHTAARLRADLMALNVALTVEGNDTATERLAHNALLGILGDLAIVTNAISNLHLAIK